MPKRILEDVVKIKNIKKPELSQNRISYNDFSDKNFKDFSSSAKKQDNKKSYNGLWFISLIAIISLFFAVSFLFSSANVTLNPKIKDFTVNKTLLAIKTTDNTEVLNYDLVILSGEEQKEVLGNEEKDWKVYASGKVLFYNSFSLLPQTISINTKLEGSNGKVYKTKSKVVIPGMTKSGTPGKIGIDIYGEKFGEEYNSDPLDFKILNLNGTTKSGKIYARSVGPITGGLDGRSSQVGDSDKNIIVEELKNTLSKKLLEKAKNQTPKDFVLLNGATFFNIDEENVVPSRVAGNFIVSIKGTFSGILFNKEKLTKEVINEFLLENNTDSVGKNNLKINDIYATNIENLSISSFDQNIVPIDNMKDLSFNLSGSVKIIWKVDENKIIEDLLDKNKIDFNKVLLQYTNIDSASMVIKPFWRNSFPDKINKIKITINYPK